MADETVDPCRLRSGRTSYPQSRTDLLERPRSRIIKLVVCLFFRDSRPEVDVRFIPDLKVPAGHFVHAVPINQMTAKVIDKLAPALPILWRRRVGFVPERVQGVGRSKLRRHETELDERANAAVQQSVVDLIDIREVVSGSSFRVLRVEADFIVKDCMESH